jgi:general secretion pathway protein A
LHEVHRLSSGIPRVINVCCDRALLGAFTRETRHISAALVRSAAGEVYGRRFAPAWIGWLAGSAAAVAVAVLLFGGWHYVGSRPTEGSAGAAANDRATADAPPPASATRDAAGAVPGMADAAPSAAGPTAVAAAVSGSPLAAAPPAALSLNLLLQANVGSTSEAAAYRRLFALWGITMPDDKNPCAQAHNSGLACFEQRGSWAEVHMLNRPAILTLTDDEGHRHHVVLTALNDKTATLVLGDHTEQLPLDDVSRYWFGEFTVVWKPKTKRTRELSVGMNGDEVRWLRRSLNALQGTASDPDQGDEFDTQLAKQVENFQREHRLNVDGIAGIRTQMVLETALADPDSPLLQPLPARGG